MTAVNLTRRSFLGAALAIPAIHKARADCATPALKIRISSDFRSFDPADAYGEDTIITRNLLAPLLRFKKSGNGWATVRHIVDSVSQEDARTYKFRLRQEGWRSGSSISTEDVKFSFERIVGRAGRLSDASNQRFWSGLRSVEITDPAAATIELNSDRSDLLTTVLPGIAGCVVNKSYVDGLSNGRFQLDPGPTSGRYDLCGVMPGVSAKLTRDESWQGDAVGVDSAVFLVIQDDNTAKEMLLAGEIDVFRPEHDVLKAITADNIAPVHRAPTSRVAMLVLGQQGALKNPDLRKAVQLAVDRKRIGSEVYADSEARVATGIVPVGWPGWSEEQLVAYDPDEAMRIVDSVGPTDKIRIAAYPRPFYRLIAEQVSGDLERVGFRTALVEISPDDYWFSIARGLADVLVARSGPQALGQFEAFSDFSSASPLGWNKSPEFDRLLATADGNDQALVDMQKLLVDDGVVTPLVEDTMGYVLRDGLQPVFDPTGEIGDLGDWSLGR